MTTTPKPHWPTLPAGSLPRPFAKETSMEPFFFSQSLGGAPTGYRHDPLDYLTLVGHKPSDRFCHTLASELADDRYKTYTVASYSDLKRVGDMSPGEIDDSSTITTRTVAVVDMANVVSFTFSEHRGQLQLAYICEDINGDRFIMSESEFHPQFTKLSALTGLSIVDLIYEELRASFQTWIPPTAMSKPSIEPYTMLPLNNALKKIPPESLKGNPGMTAYVLRHICEFNDFPFIAESGAVMFMSPETAGRRAAAALEIPELIDTEAAFKEAQRLNPHFGILKL